MSLQVRRLHLATMLDEWPVHGFLVTYPGGAVLVDTGVGGPQRVWLTTASSTARSPMRSTSTA